MPSDPLKFAVSTGEILVCIVLAVCSAAMVEGALKGKPLMGEARGTLFPLTGYFWHCRDFFLCTFFTQWKSVMLDFCSIFMFLPFVISVRIPLNGSNSTFPKSNEKLTLILLRISSWKGCFQLAFKIQEQFNFLFSPKVQKKLIFSLFNSGKVNCLPSFLAFNLLCYI